MESAPAHTSSIHRVIVAKAVFSFAYLATTDCHCNEQPRSGWRVGCPHQRGLNSEHCCVAVLKLPSRTNGRTLSCVHGNKSMERNPWERIWHSCERSDPPEPLLAVCTPTQFTNQWWTAHSLVPTAPLIECSIEYSSDPYRFSTPSQAIACRPISSMSVSHPARSGSSQQPLPHRQALIGSYRVLTLTQPSSSARTGSPAGSLAIPPTPTGFSH